MKYARAIDKRLKRLGTKYGEYESGSRFLKEGSADAMINTKLRENGISEGRLQFKLISSDGTGLGHKTPHGEYVLRHHGPMGSDGYDMAYQPSTKEKESVLYSGSDKVAAKMAARNHHISLFENLNEDTAGRIFNAAHKVYNECKELRGGYGSVWWNESTKTAYYMTGDWYPSHAVTKMREAISAIPGVAKVTGV